MRRLASKSIIATVVVLLALLAGCESDIQHTSRVIEVKQSTTETTANITSIPSYAVLVKEEDGATNAYNCSLDPGNENEVCAFLGPGDTITFTKGGSGNTMLRTKLVS